MQLQLHELNAVKSRLGAAVQERSRVTDLLCQAISFDQGQQTPREKRRGLGISLRRTPQQILPQPEKGLAENRPSTRSCVIDSHPLTRSSVMDSRPLTRGSVTDSRLLTTRGSSRQKAYSAPVPLELGGDFGGVEPEAEASANPAVLDLEPPDQSTSAGKRIITTITTLMLMLGWVSVWLTCQQR